MSDAITVRDRITTMLLGAGSLSFIGAVWATRPDTNGDFPKAMQDGLGLLLAALVFVLGFARESHRRVLEAALQAFRDSHDALLDEWTSDRPRVLPAALIELALRRVSDAAQFTNLARELSGAAASRLIALSEQQDAIADEETNLSLRLQYRRDVVGHADRAARDPDHSIPSFYRPESAKQLDRFRTEIPKIAKDLASIERKRAELERAAGVGTAELVTGPTRIRLAITTQRLMRNARRFVIGLALLYVAGVVYAGPSLQLLGSPELWVATLVMLVAVTYVRIVARDVAGELRFTAQSANEMPLSVLSRLELMLTTPSFVSDAEATERVVRFWRERGWWLLRSLELQVPGLAWANSVRGRFDLALGLYAGTSSKSARKERKRHLVSAERRLRRAADDPLALVALARTREEMGQASDGEALVAGAVELLDRIEQWRPGDRWDHTISVRDLVDGQRWLWPEQVATERLASTP